MREFKTPKGTVLPLEDLRGKNYLLAQWRILWFREEHPDWRIETEVTTKDGGTLAKATIRNALGNVVSTAHKTCTKQDFKMHVEKAETGAIARALALCGYGTQFTLELEDNVEDYKNPEHWDDTPVEFRGRK